MKKELDKKIISQKKRIPKNSFFFIFLFILIFRFGLFLFRIDFLPFRFSVVILHIISIVREHAKDKTTANQ